jgi:hypothetical protein
MIGAHFYGSYRPMAFRPPGMSTRTWPATSLFVTGLLFAIADSRGQGCQQIGMLACGYPGNPGVGTSEEVMVLTNSIPASAYPVEAVFYAPATGSFTTGTLAGPSTFYGGAGWAYASSEGLGVNMTIGYQFYRLSDNQLVLAGSCPTVSFYLDALEQATFDWSVQPVDCAAGVFRLVLTDNTSDPGDLTQSSLAVGVNYQLTKNGTAVSNGALSTVVATNPPSFVFNGLTAGTYQLTVTDNNANDMLMYCPSAYAKTFVVPNSGDCNTNVAMRAALQGALPSGALMTDGLRSANLVPGTEPYSALGYIYTGSGAGATIPPAMLTVTGNDAIEDWVVVELRNVATPSQVVYSKAALLQRDGDVIDTDGDAYVSFPVAAGNYHVAIRHRNHLGVMTGAAQALGLVPVLVDFQSGTMGCYGTTPRALVGSTYCLWAGDATGNGTIKYTGSGNDRDPILIAVGSTTPNNAVTNVYDRRDTNLDGVIKYTGTGNDRDIILTNVGSTTPNNTRVQQVP